MKCQFCSNQATIHLTDIVGKKKRETHFCESCAREHKILPESKMDPQVPAILEFLFGSQTENAARTEHEDLDCPHCGMKYAQFRGEGRLGCPKDYEIFREQLEPLLTKIQRHMEHTGKVPASFRTGQRDRGLQSLRLQLQEAVTNENYEEAARLRDLIRNKELLDEAR
jgi:protein arginine kinase activator